MVSKLKVSPFHRVNSPLEAPVTSRRPSGVHCREQEVNNNNNRSVYIMLTLQARGRQTGSSRGRQTGSSRGRQTGSSRGAPPEAVRRAPPEAARRPLQASIYTAAGDSP
ncbi:hypothetical protein KUCAC02_036847 [Chaenocephalus aceratus]|nr:hypothetical protein KUCAC02_036847 [Chaenocephalus aceratus]